MKISNQSFSKLVACVTLLLALGSCSGGGSGGGSTTTPPAPAAGSVTITGTVSGTVIWVLNATNAVIGQFDTGTLNQSPNFPFNFGNVPTGVPLRMFFVTGGAVYPLYFGNTNVFTFTSGETVDLGLVTTDTASGRATPATVPTNVTPGLENTNIPQIVVPSTASISVTNPINQAQVQGPDVPITFALQNFTIGNKNQAHLHVYLDGDKTPYEFLNEAPVLHNGGPAANAQWVSGAQIRFLSLLTNTYTVQFKLSTASHVEYVNPEASTSVQFTVNLPPPSPPTINATSPADNQTLSFGPVTVAFNVTNFTIQGPGQFQLHFYLDGNTGNRYQFLNGSNQVILNGNPAADVQWVTNSSFRFTALSPSSHSLQLVLANGDAANTELTNSKATDIVPFIVDTPPSISTVTVTSGPSFPSSPVRITFSVTDFTIGLAGTPHLRFSIDGGPQHDFYNGNGINSDNGVLLSGVHTHFVHWTSTNSFDLFGLAAGLHQVRLALVDASNTELTNAGAATTQNFTVQQPPVGDLQLESVLGGLDFPVGLSLAPDGRIFYNERLTGKIRIINQGWQLDPSVFCTVSVVTSGEQGLLGLTLDPNFTSNNQVAYVYYTAPGPVNRVSRLSKSSGVCTETIILNNLPTSNSHNGGIIRFGTDGMLYVVIGDANVPPNAQILTSLAGKIIRVNPTNGSGLSDNPFFPSGNANQDRVFSYGHRNSYGLTFHPQTNDLWESENGPADNDEINRVVAGGNYGWDANLRRGILNDSCCFDPIAVFFPLPCTVCVIAPTGIIAIPGSSSVYPPVYRNNLLVAAWNDGTIRHVILSGANLDQLGGFSVAYTGGQGGLLSFMLGSDGYVYVSNANGIFRVVPH